MGNGWKMGDGFRQHRFGESNGRDVRPSVEHEFSFADDGSRLWIACFESVWSKAVRSEGCGTEIHRKAWRFDHISAPASDRLRRDLGRRCRGGVQEICKVDIFT